MTIYLGKSCSYGLLRVPFVNYCQFMYLVISLSVLRAGYGIGLYQFLIIAYLFTLFVLPGDCRFHIFWVFFFCLFVLFVLLFFLFVFFVFCFISLCSLSYYISHMNMKHQFVTNEHHFIFTSNY